MLTAPARANAGLEIPKHSEARILRCCAQIMCLHCIPSCDGTCPFCRAPFQSRKAEDGSTPSAGEGESPYTYSTRDYSEHASYAASNDYSGTSASYTSGTYTSAGYTASNDYSTHSDFSATDYSASSTYTATTDYSSITSKYCASSCSDGAT